MKKIIIILVIVAAALLLKRALAPAPCKDCGPRGGLSMVRSALQIYYGDSEGQFPVDDLASLTADSKYLQELPLLWDPASQGEYPHPPTRGVAVYSGREPLRDTGKWAYFNDPSNETAWGHFFIDCTHAQLLRGNGLFPASRPGNAWSTF